MAERQTPDVDRMLQAFYVAAFEHGWTGFRPRALRLLGEWSGAIAVAWLTRAATDLPGEFAVWPEQAGIERDAIAEIVFPSRNGREVELESIPESWRSNVALKGASALALNVAHRGAPMNSVVCVVFPAGHSVQRDALRRVVGHLAQAATLSLMQFIQRDEWLNSLGRPSRGNAALVDAKGGVYVASARFDEMLQEELGDIVPGRLPFVLPPDIVQAGHGDFQISALHFRLTRAGRLFLLHARRPHPLDVLSPREQEIARALVEGKTFKSVAREHDIAISTVANHASRIYKKLSIYRREDLVDLLRAANEPPLNEV